MPASTRGQCEVLQGLMFQRGSVGSMVGQAHHFGVHELEKIGCAIEHYANEAERLYGVMNKRLGHSSTIVREALLGE